MKQYIKVSNSKEHYCNACGKKQDEMFDISFVQDCENGNVRSQGFHICWNCSIDLGIKMEDARKHSFYNE